MIIDSLKKWLNLKYITNIHKESLICKRKSLVFNLLSFVVEVSISRFEFDATSGNNLALKLDRQEIFLINPYRIPNNITLFL